MKKEPEKVAKTSESIENENLQKLRVAFPNFVKDRQVDFDALQKFFDKEGILSGEEKFGLNWAGKSSAFRAIRTPATGTLIPQPEESKNWDSTENIFIEGDNLEVLKLLQKNYREKIKMIYIDPPYNTGKDFVYKDNFTQEVADYYEQTGQTKGGIKMTANTEKNGRYHSDWLTMMYPRLFLGRNLLKDDGVIFVSIDDNEVANLRIIMDEIFGEENFVESFVWKKKGGASNTETIVGNIFEHILMFSKNKRNVITNRREIDSKQFSYKDENGFYFLQSLLKTDSGMYKRDTMKFGVINSKTGEKTFPMKGKRWTVGEKTMNEYLQNNLLEFVVNKDGVKDVRKKEYFIENDPQTGVYLNLLLEKGSLKSAKTELENLDFGREVFDTPKPSLLIKHLLEIITRGDDLVLDFFAGSGTTAHAVMDLNTEEENIGNRKWICVQLPEITDKESEAYKAGYNTIAEISRERIRRAGEKIGKGDTDFKSYKLFSSNYRQWNVTGEQDEKEILKTSKLFLEKPLVDKYDEKSVVYEILLKEGFGLNSKIEQQKDTLKLWVATDGEKKLFVTFAEKVSKEQVKKLALFENDTFVCFDSALDDTTKVNLGRNINVKTI